jgi:tRNA nucleotidyltransferase/poly(A) polymerase
MKHTPGNPALDLLTKRTEELTTHAQEEKIGLLKIEGKMLRAIEREPILYWIPQFFEDHPHAELFLVGGAVRDALLKKQNKDYDFVIRGLPHSAIGKWLESREEPRKPGDEKKPVGKNFGVFKFSPKGFPASRFEEVDIAMPRTEHCEEGSTGAYRDVEVQSDHQMPIEEDLGRRDLTINAMAFDVKTGDLIDLYGGRKDLEQGIIRAVGDPKERFNEDMSRMFRAIRMASQLDFTIEPETWGALVLKMEEINKKVPATDDDGKIQKDKNGNIIMCYAIPRETITREVAKALTRNPSKAINLLYESGAMRMLLPNLHALREQDPERFAVLSHIKKPDLAIIYALIMRGLSTKELRRSFKMIDFQREGRGTAIRAERRDIVELVEWINDPNRPQKLMELRPWQFRKKLFNTQGERYLTCLRALGHEHEASMLEKTRNAMMRNCGVDHYSQIHSLVTGNDVMQAFGIVKGGPQVGEILRRAVDLQLTGEGRTKEEIIKKLLA